MVGRERFDLHAFLAILLAVIPLAAALPAGAALPSRSPCEPFALEVSLAEGAPAETVVVRGELCGRDAPRGRPIQLLIAGATESGMGYWDFGGDAPRAPYSYARWLAAQGYPSLVLDRIGTGASDRPGAIETTIPSNAYVVHQVVEALRAGEIDHRSFDTIVGVGRSLGGPILWTASTTYGGLDGIIVQSFSRHQQPGFFQFPASLMPAQLEPRFADSPEGYLTTRPDARAPLFFYLANADPAVVAAEERVKDTVTIGEIATFPPSFSTSDTVAVPVLVQLGDRDTFFCTAPGCPETETEASYFPAAPSIDVQVVIDAGHDINLQLNGPTEAFPGMLRWVVRTFE